MLSSKNELKLIHIGGSFCSASISISVSAGSQILFIVLSKSFKRFRLVNQEIWEKMSKKFRKNEVLSTSTRSRILWGWTFFMKPLLNFVCFNIWLMRIVWVRCALVHDQLDGHSSREKSNQHLVFYGEGPNRTLPS